MGLTGMALKKLKDPIFDFIHTAQDQFSKVKQIVKDYVITPITNMLEPLKNLISLAISWIVNKFQSGFGAIPKTLVSQINALISKINTGLKISIPPYLQAILGTKSWSPNITPIKLARGGIINNPGKGVALGSNIIGGERKETGQTLSIVAIATYMSIERNYRTLIIDATFDDETMERLGSAIARHMTINATMINQMNGRTISRELKQINNESDFGYNG